MGDKHLFNSSLQGDNDHGRQHVEQLYIQPVSTGASEGSTFNYPLNNLTVEGGHGLSQWQSTAMSVGYSSSDLNAEITHYHQQIPGPFVDPLVHASTGGNIVPDCYGRQVSSSNHGGQFFHRVDGDCLEPAVANSRGQYKRRSPNVPVIFERGSTSRYWDAGSSSNQFIPFEPRLDKSSLDSYRAPRNSIPSSGLSIGGEGNLRNVRSRPSFDLENNLGQAQFSNAPQSPFTMTVDHPISTGFLATSSSAPSREHNPGFPSHASMGQNVVSDPNLFGHEASHFNVVIGNPVASHRTSGHLNNFLLNRHQVPQTSHDFSSQYARGVRSSNVQRPVSNFRASSSNLTVGNTSLSNEGTQFAQDSRTSQHTSPFSTVVFRERGRIRVSGDRYRTFPEDARFRDRLMLEADMIAEHSAMSGSRSLFDQHRDLRLDIDNMSYEELSALVERIGNVNTGLSDDLIPKCLTELIFCSSDHVQDEGRCVICLEEYKHMDDIGTLKKCGHDFHVHCIRKWLSMKNLCPICKAAALDDSMKNK